MSAINEHRLLKEDICVSDPAQLSEVLQRQRALSRWNDEGGAEPDGPQTAPDAVWEQPLLPKMGDAEFEALHVRVIALENLVIALLTVASDRQLELAREMASYIAPRAGYTRHKLTIHAAGHITDIVERAVRFRSKQA